MIESPENEPISSRLKRLRQKAGLRTTEVANQLGIANSTYRDWEMGRKILGEPYLDLAKILGVSVSELLGGTVYCREQLLRDIEAIEEILTRLRLSL